MYSIVLMAALTAGQTAPDAWGNKGCYGCSSCNGFAGCWGVAGCFQCHGCHGCYGCYGCHGFGACYGACYGMCYGGFQPYGGAMGPGWGMPYSGYGPAGHGGHAVMGAPPVMMAPATTPSTSEKPKAGKEEGEARLGDRARLIVNLPAGAKLYVDDQPVANATEVGSFRTPRLQPGQAYFYELKAEVVRDGKPVSETRRVVLKAGEVIRADFRSLDGQTGFASAKK